MPVDYDHSKNLHSLEGPRAAFQLLFPDRKPASLLDVGCGTGTWLRAAMECGVTDVWGLDGVLLPPERLLFPAEKYGQQDFSRPWDLGRRFDVVLCLEVAEHLDEGYDLFFCRLPRTGWTTSRELPLACLLAKPFQPARLCLQRRSPMADMERCPD
jgi:SAM-dependent methyltransferase